MAKVEGFIKLAAQLSARGAKKATSPKCSVVVGYTGAHAIQVHEAVAMVLKGLPRPSGKGVYWGPHGQAKFLEAPARLLDSSGELARIITEAMDKGKTLAQALLLAGLRIQRESQKVVPVEYGLLRASAFTILETS